VGVVKGLAGDSPPTTKFRILKGGGTLYVKVVPGIVAIGDRGLGPGLVTVTVCVCAAPLGSVYATVRKKLFPLGTPTV
jgi:hypothetical protein